MVGLLTDWTRWSTPDRSGWFAAGRSTITAWSPASAPVQLLRSPRWARERHGHESIAAAISPRNAVPRLRIPDTGVSGPPVRARRRNTTYRVARSRNLPPALPRRRGDGEQRAAANNVRVLQAVPRQRTVAAQDHRERVTRASRSSTATCDGPDRSDDVGATPGTQVGPCDADHVAPAAVQRRVVARTVGARGPMSSAWWSNP